MQDLKFKSYFLPNVNVVSMYFAVRLSKDRVLYYSLMYANSTKMAKIDLVFYIANILAKSNTIFVRCWT